jgi:hypothetical protein
MAASRRKLSPGETVIGFVRLDGSLVGQFADPVVGHSALASAYAGFLEFLFAKLGRSPVEIRGGTTLGQLCDSLEKRQLASEVPN